MSKITTVTNDYQKYILSQLKTREYVRFKDLMPPKISSNTFSYHLKALQNDGWIVKSEAGYSLGAAGLAYIERETESKNVRMQPNILVALLVQDGYGKVLLHKKTEQPYINQWELPVVHAAVADTSVRESGIWAAKKLLHYMPESLRHAGDCYIRIHRGKVAVGSSLVHVIRFEIDDYAPRPGYEWVEPLQVGVLPHVPGLEQIMSRAFFNDDYFFEEYTVQLSTQKSLGI